MLDFKYIMPFYVDNSILGYLSMYHCYNSSRWPLGIFTLESIQQMVGFCFQSVL